jgi:broad specificity phosphatase PhoE
MARFVRRLAIAASLSWVSSAAVARAQSDPGVTVFIVRHAEKASAELDASLSRAGEARSKELARMLSDVGITNIYVSQFKRTQETAVPLAKEIHRNPVIADAGKTDDLVAGLKALPAGSRALVVTHSNLIQPMIEKLSGQKVTELTDTDYDHLYVVTLSPNGGSVLYLHYGAPSPTGPGGPMR